jgi:hypothetical protein
MADPTFIKIASADDVRNAGWATEVTLARLLDQARDQTSALNVMAKIDTKAKREAAETAKALKDLKKGTDEYAEALEDVVKQQQRNARIDDLENEKTRLANRRYRQSLDDLRGSMRRLQSLSSGRGVFDSLTEGLTSFEARLRSNTGLYRAAGIGLGVFNRGLIVAAGVFGALQSMTDSFSKVVDSGLTFEGSLVRFSNVALSSGFTLEQFTRLAVEHSQSISAMGAAEASASIRRFRDASRQFGFYGMHMDELAAAQMRYADSLRESGLIYYMNATQQEQVTHDYLRNLTALSVLQGRSRRQIEDEQRAAQRRSQIQLTIERIRRAEGPDAAAAIERRYGEAVTQIGQMAADVAFAQEFNLGGPTRAEGIALGVSGLLPGRIDFRSDEGLARGIQAQQARVMQTPTEMLDVLALAARRQGIAAPAADELVNLLQRARPPSAGDRAPDRVAAADRARRGEIVDQTTTNLIDAQNSFREGLTGLQRAAINAADALGLLSGVAGAAAGVGSMFSGGAAALAGAGGGILGSLGGAALGALMFAPMLRGAGGGLFGGRAPTFGPPPPPDLPGGGRGFGGGMGRLGGGAGIGAIAGIAAGAGTAALGGPQWLSGILSGAGTGAALGSIIPGVGTLLGAGVGAGLGLLSSQLGGGGEATPGAAAPTAAPVMPAFSAGFDRLNTSLETLLGPNGAMATRLDQLILINEDTRALTKRILANQ